MQEAIKNTRVGQVKLLSYFMQESYDSDNLERNLEILADEIISNPNYKINKKNAGLMHNLKNVLVQGYGKELVTTASIIGGQMSNEILESFKKDTKAITKLVL
eukprot:CAMPEP_0116917022 /NCGR_PEP_ID=MMETSP0467-20121206/18891_1 /TAXON_ID=283647 /ORGANISM="Mesodinium pulex, Strain SPMC105" /LENGTH=102 /DNA_ID=CAMNT_0004594027 /DNA_START=512 /DNA_END=820 /DNA_ORIENTATION=+